MTETTGAGPGQADEKSRPTEEATYVVAAVKAWNISAFARHVGSYPGKWMLVSDPKSLDGELLRSWAPRYIFFPHWSWRVPDEILAATECVCFHMADVPYGRGGSPLQNLIARGHTETKVAALRMVPDLDAGPVYMKRPLRLEGAAHEIFARSAEVVYDMIGEIVATEPVPVPQEGEPVMFSRRTPAQSELPESASLAELYDHVRMLDAEGYPPAFVDYGNFRILFHDARLDGNTLGVRAEIVAKDREIK